jgi:hypothetical protein
MDCKYNVPGDCTHPENNGIPFWERIHKSNYSGCMFFEKKERIL